MARPCSICTHPERAALDAALVANTPRTRLEAAFGVTEQSLARHAAKHLPLTLARAADVAEVARADDLLAQVQRLQGETLAVLEAAKAAGNLAGVLAAVDRAQKGVALMGTMLAGAHAARSLDPAPEAAELPGWVREELRALGERYARGRTERQSDGGRPGDETSVVRVSR
jgi:hypothetical protein